MKLGILNTTACTADGVYQVKTITTEEAIDLVEKNLGNLDSAVGHQTTAQMMTTILGQEIVVNRQQFEQKPGQQCLVFKLNGRAPEAVVLSAEEAEAIGGFTFKLMSRLS